MYRLAGIVSSSLCLAAYCSLAASAQTSIYSGEASSASTLSVGPWGSGVVLETTENTYIGSRSVKTTSFGKYQGVRIVLANPVDIKNMMSDGNSLLQVVYDIKDKSETTNTSTSKFGKGGMSMPGGGNGSGGRQQGGIGQGGGLKGGSGGSGTTTTTSEEKTKTAENMRIVLGMEDGKKFELSMELANSRLEHDSWRSLSIPVSAISGLTGSSGRLKDVSMFTDQPATFYLGQIRLVQDETPIHVDDLSDQTIAKNDTITIPANSEAGPTQVKYTWTIKGIVNPDTGTNANPNYLVTLEGKKFKHQFRKSGDFEVTLTASDVYGKKKPTSTKMIVHVTL